MMIFVFMLLAFLGAGAQWYLHLSKRGKYSSSWPNMELHITDYNQVQHFHATENHRYSGFSSVIPMKKGCFGLGGFTKLSLC